MKDQGSFEINLVDAQEGNVVTRFPPEPSGYLHIGHAKAVLLNEYFARKYKGKLILRFDDTNATKETGEFEETIKEDLNILEVYPDTTSHTSDHFDMLRQKLVELIQKGYAYADDTSQEEMRRQRGCGEASKCRDRSVEENLFFLLQMEKGMCEETCIRAKISVDDKNKAMRDPVIYRGNTAPHYRTGTKYKIYPTYDFACPIVDSIEGVTHALRTSEYRDRNKQYNWLLDKLGMRKPHLWDYSRLAFTYTLLSKRKLMSLVQTGIVSGWDDPRFPTIRGITRRGLLVSALKKYILMQGASKNILLLEWDKLWSLNKKEMDATVPRYMAVASKDVCVLEIEGAEDSERLVPLNKKRPQDGMKKKDFTGRVLIEQTDALLVQEKEVVTLMDWDNVTVLEVVMENGKAVLIKARLSPGGDYKKTKKLSWISSESFFPFKAVEYGFLLNKKKMEESDRLEDVLTAKSKFSYDYKAEKSLAFVLPGQVIQIERNSNFICDSQGVFIRIPDGKAKSTRWICV